MAGVKTVKLLVIYQYCPTVLHVSACTTIFRHKYAWFKEINKPNALKVKVTLVQALRLRTGRTAHRGSRGIALLFLDQQHWKGVRGQRHAPAALYPRERPGTHCTGGWVGPRAVVDRCGKSHLNGIRSPDRPARSQSLHRLSCPTHKPNTLKIQVTIGLLSVQWDEFHQNCLPITYSLLLKHYEAILSSG